MAISTTKHALLFTIILVSMKGINSQQGVGMAVRNNTALLENLTDMSTVTAMFLANTLNRSADAQSRMEGSLDQITTTQTQMADTQSEIVLTQSHMANILNRSADTQSSMGGTLDHIANTQTRMADTQSEMVNIVNQSADTQSSMDGSLDQIANTQTQMADTQSEMVNIMNRSVATQSSMDGSLDQIANTQTQMASTQSSMDGSLDQMANTQTLVANTFTQVVQLLQIQSQQLQNMTDTMSHMVEQINTQNNLISLLPTKIPRDCSDLASRGPYSSVSYTIRPWDDLGYLRVYCDMDTDNGGWTVFQKRFNGSVDFYLGWDDYEDGFGSSDGEYWLGLRQLHRLTQQGSWMLRIDLADFQNNTAFAEFESFSIGNSASNYQLSVGGYNGTAGGDALAYHNNQAFSTKDNDHDSSSSQHCAESYKGGWWYNACRNSNLNGLYLGESQNSHTGMVWYQWKNSNEVLKRSEMKMRRIR